MTLTQLDTWSFTIFKKFLDARAIFAGSDFDIDRAVRTALDEIDEVDFQELKSLAGLQPILAKRHYHDTGALRWFDVNIVPVSGLTQPTAGPEPDRTARSVSSSWPSRPREKVRQYAEALCREAARHGVMNGTRSSGFQNDLGRSCRWHANCWLSTTSPTIIRN